MRNFRAFALKHYQSPGIQTRLLALQDKHGCDVLVLLYCAWQTAMGQVLEPAALARLADSVAIIQNHLIRPLRAARRGICGVAHESCLCSTLRARELAMEELEMAMLQRHCPVIGESAHDPHGLLPLNADVCAGLFDLDPREVRSVLQGSVP